MNSQCDEIINDSNAKLTIGSTNYHSLSTSNNLVANMNENCNIYIDGNKVLNAYCTKNEENNMIQL